MVEPEISPELVTRALAGSFPGDLGVEVVSIADEEVHGRLEVDRRHLPPGSDFTTIELKANVFAAGRPGDVLEAVARPLHVGRRTQVWEVLLRREERRVAFFTCTQMVLAPAAEG